MNAATARVQNDPAAEVAAAIAAAREESAPAIDGENKLMDEIQIGFDQLRQMSHEDLRQVIMRRVHMLDNVLREREDRRAAIETARLAQRMLEIRRERALKIKRRVDRGSALAAAACTVIIFVAMI